MKGSVTIEASIVMMLILFIFVGTISLTVSATEKIRQASEFYVENCKSDLREREEAQWIRKVYAALSGMKGEEGNGE